MILRDPELLTSLMAARDMTGARLARAAGGKSRQFIHQLQTRRRRSCADNTAILIEAALGVRPGTLFTADVDAKTKQGVAA